MTIEEIAIKADLIDHLTQIATFPPSLKPKYEKAIKLFDNI